MSLLAREPTHQRVKKRKTQCKVTKHKTHQSLYVFEMSIVTKEATSALVMILVPQSSTSPLAQTLTRSHTETHVLHTRGSKAPIHYDT